MLEKLIDLIQNTWDRLSPIYLVYQYQEGLLFRFGKVYKRSEPGFHLKIPLADRADVYDNCIETLRTDPQAVTTKDGQTMLTRVIVKFQMDDIERYVTKISDHVDALEDFTAGAVRTCIHEMTYSELLENPPEKKILDMVRKEVNQYGFKVHKITFTTLSKGRPIFLVTGSSATLGSQVVI